MHKRLNEGCIFVFYSQQKQSLKHKFELKRSSFHFQCFFRPNKNSSSASSSSFMHYKEQKMKKCCYKLTPNWLMGPLKGLGQVKIQLILSEVMSVWSVWWELTPLAEHTKSNMLDVLYNISRRRLYAPFFVFSKSYGSSKAGGNVTVSQNRRTLGQDPLFSYLKIIEKKSREVQ